MDSYYWKEVALRLLPKHAAIVAAAIFQEQADRTGATWFTEHSEASIVLDRCVDSDPAGVWKSLASYLEPAADAYMFVIGFPLGILNRLPIADVHAWIAIHPEDRAPVVARLVAKDLSNDETLAAQLLSNYGHDENLRSAFLSAFMTGGWAGRTSEHWDQIAASLEAVAQRTARTQVRSWAQEAAHSFRQMAERDREREAEEDVPHR